MIAFSLAWLAVTFPNAWGWGAVGHRIVAELGTKLASPQALSNCHVTVPQLTDHTNDPDVIWRQQRIRHPHEAEAHFFHVDRQPPDWRSRDTAKDRSQGQLVYRIVSWVEEARKLRKSQSWDALAETLYGLSHYLGDLTQPLHLNHDYDGQEAGLPDLHAQFETKMLNRYEADVRSGVSARLSAEKVPALWKSLDLKLLIFDSAQQSGAKARRLFDLARPALRTARSRRHRANETIPRFVKPILWKSTGSLAMDQLALGARLWGYVLESVCK